jgi:hypothetical protein
MFNLPSNSKLMELLLMEDDVIGVAAFLTSLMFG